MAYIKKQTIKQKPKTFSDIIERLQVVKECNVAQIQKQISFNAQNCHSVPYIVLSQA